MIPQSEGGVKSFTVSLCERSEIKDFIETWHYSKSINGLKSNYCFKLEDANGQLIGAMLYGQIAMAGVWKKYAAAESELIELRRLCCIDATPKNTESYFIGKTLKWLKKHTGIKTVISYADETYGHTGVIYQASNFTKSGVTSPGKVIMYNGKKYHDRAVRVKYNGSLKPFALHLKNMLLAGKAHYEITKGKFIYIYKLVK